MTLRWQMAALVGLTLTSTLHAAPANGPAANLDPALVVRVQSIERLLADAKHVTGRIGGAAAVQKLEAGIAELCGQQGLTGSGLDLRKPLGLYGIVRTDLASSILVTMIPVSDEKAFLALLERHEVKAERLADNVFTLTTEALPTPLFLRLAHGYAYIAPQNRSAVDQDQLIAPERMFAGDEPALASIVARFDKVPDSVRAMAGLQLNLLAGLAGLGAEVPADERGLEHDLDEAQSKAMMRWAKLLLNDAKELSLKVNFDRNSGELSVDFAGQARDGTPMARTFSALPPPQSLFTRIIRDDAAANLLVASPLVDEQRQALVTAFTTGLDATVAELEIGDEGRDAFKKLAAALAPSLEQGFFDCAVSLRGPVKDRYGIIGGLRLKDARKVEAAFRELVKSLPDDEQKKFTWDLAKLDGVSIHRYKVVDDDGEKTVKLLFGDQPLFVAFRDDCVLVAFGEGGKQQIEESLRTIKLAPAPSATLDFSLKRVTKLFELIDPDAPTWLAKVVGDGIERVRLFHATAEGGTKLTARYAFNVQFFVGMALMFDDDDEFVPPVPVPVQPPMPPPGNPPPAPLPPAPPPPMPPLPQTSR